MPLEQWHGTVLQNTWKPAAVMVLASIALALYMDPVRTVGEHKWSFLEVPHEAEIAMAALRVPPAGADVASRRTFRDQSPTEPTRPWPADAAETLVRLDAKLSASCA